MEQLKQALSQRQKRRIVDKSRTSAAVMVPLCHQNGEYYLLFTKRTERVLTHKGQISFPGGAYEGKDGVLVNTALRECAEEIGLSPEVVEMLGELDDMATIGSNYIISPFVAVIPWECSFKAQPEEVEEIIKVPISVLLDKTCVRCGTDILDGKMINAYFYQYQDRVIWGATARILNQFLDIFAQALKNQEH